MPARVPSRPSDCAKKAEKAAEAAARKAEAAAKRSERFERNAKSLSFSPVDFYRKAKITDEELRRPRAVVAVKEQLVLWAFMEVGLKWIKESRADHPHMVPPWLPKLQAHFPIMGNELRLFVTLDKSKPSVERREFADARRTRGTLDHVATEGEWWQTDLDCKLQDYGLSYVDGDIVAVQRDNHFVPRPQPERVS